MKKILIPTDFSSCANNAAEFAMQLAKKAKSEIHFLHILNTPVEWRSLRKEQEKNFPETLRQIGHAKAELTRLELKAKKAGLKVKVSLAYGNDDVAGHLKEYGCDFIVMGSHGAEGLKELIGSNTQKVVRYAPVPVMVVKDKPKKFIFKNVVFASTFEEDIQQPFKKVLEFSQLFNAGIHLLYVNMPFKFKTTKEAEADMNKLLKKYPKVSCSINIYNSRDEEQGIQAFAEDVKADVIALTTHGKTGFMKMLSPSITESIVNHSDKPVLSVNIKK